MGREVRRVPADWQHPKNKRGHFNPLFDGAEFPERLRTWDEGAAKWAEGLRQKHNGEWVPIGETDCKTFEEWAGNRPDPANYMPLWSDSERTHLMMYETTSEGTPISPAFATPEELARWLADTGASAFGNDTASYESWLRVARGGYACSAVYTSDKGLQSGVEALT